MHKIKVTDSAGQVLQGTIPTSWAEVQLGPYAALAAAADWNTRAAALAAVCGLPAAVFTSDTSHCVPILEVAPFLLNGPLPEAAEGIPASFTHLGVTYVPAPADLERISGDQLEYLTRFLAEAEGDALGASRFLLAILFKPAGTEGLPESVIQATADAFATLPMSVGYPLLLNFWKRSEALALPIQRYLALRPGVEKLRNALEAVSIILAQPASSWSLRRWLTRLWLRLVSKQLKTF
jgi:hypothetical protein